MIPAPPLPVAARGEALTALYLPALWRGTLPVPEVGEVSLMVNQVGDPIVEVASSSRAGGYWDLSTEDALLISFPAALLGPRSRIAERRDAWDPFLYGIAHAIRCGFRAARPPTQPYLDSLGPAIAGHLRRNYLRERGLSHARLACVLTLIEQRLDQALEVDELAGIAHLSAYHFSRMFKRSTGQAPHAYITQRRIERARDLLAGSDLLIADIAGRVGYGTQAHFTTAFLGEVGVTPRQYRVRHARTRIG